MQSPESRGCKKLKLPKAAQTSEKPQKPKCHLPKRNWECKGCERPKPRSRKAQKLRSQKAKKPRSRKAKKPESQKANKPRSQEAKKPKAKKPKAKSGKERKRKHILKYIPLQTVLWGTLFGRFTATHLDLSDFDILRFHALKSLSASFCGGIPPNHFVICFCTCEILLLAKGILRMQGLNYL